MASSLLRQLPNLARLLYEGQAHYNSLAPRSQKLRKRNEAEHQGSDRTSFQLANEVACGPSSSCGQGRWRMLQSVGQDEGMKWLPERTSRKPFFSKGDIGICLLKAGIRLKLNTLPNLNASSNLCSLESTPHPWSIHAFQAHLSHACPPNEAGLRRPGAKEHDAQLTEQEACQQGRPRRRMPSTFALLHKDDLQYCGSRKPTTGSSPNRSYMVLPWLQCTLVSIGFPKTEVLQESVRLSRLEFEHKSEAQMARRLRSLPLVLFWASFNDQTTVPCTEL